MSWSMTTLVAAWALVGSPGDMVAVATAVLAALALVLAARLVTGMPSAPARLLALPARSRRGLGRVVRAGDPDAAGRPRPRAPGA